MPAELAEKTNVQEKKTQNRDKIRPDSMISKDNR